MDNYGGLSKVQLDFLDATIFTNEESTKTFLDITHPKNITIQSKMAQYDQKIFFNQKTNKKNHKIASKLP